MAPRIQTLAELDDFRLAVEFNDGYKIIYDVKEDIGTFPSFRPLSEIYGLFGQAQHGSMTCVYWNEEIDLSMDCVYKYGSVAYTVEQGTNERSLSPVHQEIYDNLSQFFDI